MKILAFSFNFWQYPVLMSIFQFLQSFSGIYFKTNSLMLNPFLSAFSHLIVFIQEDISILYESYSSSRDTKMNDTKNKHKRFFKSNPVFVFSRIEIEEHDDSYTIRLILLLVALGIVNIFPHFLYMIYALIQDIASLQSFLNILFTSMFCYLILKTKLYIHHYLALAILALDIGFYMWYKYDFINKDMSTIYSNWGLFFALTFMYIIPTSLREVLEKYIMQTYYLTSSIIILFEGVFLLVVFFIYFFIIQYVQCENNASILSQLCMKSQWDVVRLDIKLNFNYSTIATLFAWMYVLSVYFASLFRVETINKLTPMHRFVGEMLQRLYWYIYYLSTKKDIVYWLELVLMFPLLIASFVFNEFIIIRRCGLDYYTRSEIAKRGKRDMQIAIETSAVITSGDDGDRNELVE